MKKITYFSLFLFALLACVSFSCTDDSAEPSRNIRIEFENVVGNQSMQLGDQTYTNANGDTYTVSTFMYFVSNFRLVKADGSTYDVPESYFLINHEDSTSRTITLSNIPAGDYKEISFLIGVDSTRNTSGAQTGALDLISGMFWSWDAGYIFVKMEGNSPQSTQPYNKLQFHIGGYRGATNCIRTTSPSLNGNIVKVGTGTTPELHYRVDMAKLFVAPNPVNFATLSAIHGGLEAVKLADNYQSMFTFDRVHYAN